MYVVVYIYTHVFVFKYVNMYVYFVPVYIAVRMNVNIFQKMCMCLYVMYVYICVRIVGIYTIYIYIYIYIHPCIYFSTHTHTHSCTPHRYASVAPLQRPPIRNACETPESKKWVNTVPVHKSEQPDEARNQDEEETRKFKPAKRSLRNFDKESVSVNVMRNVCMYVCM